MADDVYDLTVTDSGAGLDAILGKANTALQPEDVETVAISGAYSDLSGTPILGTAAATASTAYATAAQGSLANSALQPEDVGESVQGYDAATAKLDIAQSWTAKQTFKLFEADAGTLTADSPVVISQTWDNASVGFTGLKVAVTNTQSASSSYLASFAVGSVNAFLFDRSGSIIFDNGSSGNAVKSKIGANGINMRSDLKLTWTGNINSSAPNLTISQQVPYSLDLYTVSKDPVAFKLSNTYASESENERAALSWISNRFVIATEAAGTGTKRGITLEASDLILANLPTTDPGVAGQPWLDGTALKVSAG